MSDSTISEDSADQLKVAATDGPKEMDSLRRQEMLADSSHIAHPKACTTTKASYEDLQTDPFRHLIPMTIRLCVGAFLSKQQSEDLGDK